MGPATSTKQLDIDAIVQGRHRDPFAVLGPHASTKDGKAATVIRAFLPDARKVIAKSGLNGDGSIGELTCVHAAGFFEGWFADLMKPFQYRLDVEYLTGHRQVLVDPFAMPPMLSDFDLHLLGEGKHLKNFERLGSHLRTVDGVEGVSFAVWAPNAWRVSVVGDFNRWDGRRHVMRFHPGVGVWELFVPGLNAGAVYKFEILGADGMVLPLRTDPYGFFFELRPKTASIVYDIAGYDWQDGDWMSHRRERQALDKPMSVYEVHLGSWLRSPDHPEQARPYMELAERLVAYVKDMGFTHIELLPITEHPYDGSWGYQALGYFAPTSRHGSPKDFMAFVDYCHRHDVGVIVDWVPAHFPRDDHGLRMFDGTALYEHEDPRRGEHKEWGTLVFNYGRHEVANYLLGSALFWFDKYHIDGIRVDAVASMLYLDYNRPTGEWIPNEHGGNENLEAVAFIKRFNEVVYAQFPDVVTVAEESTAWAGVTKPTYAGGLGFLLKWNMGWMNDTLRYIHRDPLYRKHHQGELTFSLVYAFSENFTLPFSHDEVVHGKGSLLDKMPGSIPEKFANLRLVLGYMFAHPGKKLLFMGCEFGQWQEWRFYQSLDWHLTELKPHKGVQNWVRDLNRLLATEPSLYEVDTDYAGFQWVDLHDWQNSTLAFLRRGKQPGEEILTVLNFTPIVRTNHRVGVSTEGRYKEILSSDWTSYDGAGIQNEAIAAAAVPTHGLPFSIEITLPALACLMFKRQRGTDR